MDVRMPADAAATLELVGGQLRESGADGDLSLGLLHRLVADPGAWGPEVTYLVAEGDGRPAALVTMTGSHPMLVTGFTEAEEIDFRQIVRALVEAGVRPSGVNGARRCSDPFAAAWGQLTGVAIRHNRDMCAFELREVVPPRPTGGELRAAGDDEHDLLLAWSIAFAEDIRDPSDPADLARTVRRLTAAGDLCTWVVDDRVVSMAAINRRTPWSSSVGLVYTPPELRGRGYASEVVAALSQRELDAGQSWCSLFTDMANPTSNHIYAELGYEPRCAFRHYLLDWT